MLFYESRLPHRRTYGRCRHRTDTPIRAREGWRWASVGMLAVITIFAVPAVFSVACAHGSGARLGELVANMAAGRGCSWVIWLLMSRIGSDRDPCGRTHAAWLQARASRAFGAVCRRCAVGQG